MSLALTSTAWFLITVGYFVVVSQLNLAHAWCIISAHRSWRPGHHAVG